MDQDSSPSIVYPQVSEQSVELPLKKLLEKAKDSIDVIDFRTPRKYQDHVRRTRQPEDGYYKDVEEKEENKEHEEESKPVKEAILTNIDFPGVENIREIRGSKETETDVKHNTSHITVGNKNYYIGIFFKANWYRAEQYCRFHGMHLASINSRSEQADLESLLQSYGMGHQHFWTSGTDQAEEGKFFWMSTGRPITYENWNAGEPNNFQYDNGEQEHCLELWNRDGKGMRWNDTPCSFETFFVCEVS